MTVHPLPPPHFSDIEAAARRLEGVAVKTPLLPAPELSRITGATVFVKAECLQRTGSFKFRGAFNRLSLIDADVRRRGVVACSSGNHAQGVAAAAALYEVPATIVMPRDAPASKIARTRRLGAEVVLYDRRTEDREAISHAIADKTGATFVHPYDDPGVMAGQGTVGLEVVAQSATLGIVPDFVLAPASGGGLIGGIALAIHETFHQTQVVVVEPEGFDDHGRSLAAGKRVSNAEPSGSVCDALMAQTPGRVTFAVNSQHLAGGAAVSDAEALAAVAHGVRELKLVIEPGGAVGLAALLSGKLEVAGRTVVVVASGGNIDDDMLVRALTA